MVTLEKRVANWLQMAEAPRRHEKPLKLARKLNEHGLTEGTTNRNELPGMHHRMAANQIEV